MKKFNLTVSQNVLVNQVRDNDTTVFHQILTTDDNIGFIVKHLGLSAPINVKVVAHDMVNWNDDVLFDINGHVVSASLCGDQVFISFPQRN